MAARIRALLEKPVLRFLLVGGLNTLATGLLVALLSLVMPGWIAFTIAFAIGLVFSVFMTGRWVFQAETTLSRALTFAAAYAVIYLCGLGLVQILTLLNMPAMFNGLTVFVTAPLGFLAGKYVFRQDRVSEVES